MLKCISLKRIHRESVWLCEVVSRNAMTGAYKLNGGKRGLRPHFEYTASRSRVCFGFRSFSKLTDELALQDLYAALILYTPRQIEKATKIKQLLASNVVAIFSKDQRRRYRHSRFHGSLGSI
jgi:uncharacterized protein YdeI (YjbR/CyaY-like superfamily)